MAQRLLEDLAPDEGERGADLDSGAILELDDDLAPEARPSDGLRSAPAAPAPAASAARLDPLGGSAGTTRSAEKGKALEEAGIRPFVFDGASLSEELLAELAETTLH